MARPAQCANFLLVFTFHSHVSLALNVIEGNQGTSGLEVTSEVIWFHLIVLERNEGVPGRGGKTYPRS